MSVPLQVLTEESYNSTVPLTDMDYELEKFSPYSHI